MSDENTGVTENPCPYCGSTLYRGTYQGRRALRCSNPYRDCGLANQWPQGDTPPVARSVAQLQQLTCVVTQNE